MRHILKLFLSFSAIVITACGRPESDSPTSAPSNDPIAVKNKESANGIHSTGGWAKLPVEISIPDSFSTAQKASFRAALQTWNNAAGMDLFASKDINVNGDGDRFKDLYEPLADRLNVIYWLPSNWLGVTKKSKAVLATTVWENDINNSNVISRADILFNSNFYIFGDSTQDNPANGKEIVDLESIALHELGHLLGLSHIEAEQESSIMNPTFLIGVNSVKRDLSAGDVSRIRSIYNNRKSLSLEDSAAPSKQALRFSY